MLCCSKYRKLAAERTVIVELETIGKYIFHWNAKLFCNGLNQSVEAA